MYALCSHVVSSNLSTSDFTTSISVNRTDFSSCGASTYLRSGVGGAPLPWIIALVLLIANVANVIVRIKKFEAAQTFSMVLSFATAFVVTLAYVSTHFAPEKVMVWTPILLVGNAGSLLQVFVFVIEKHGSHWSRLGRRGAQGSEEQDIELRNVSATPNPEALKALTANIDSRALPHAIPRADIPKKDVLIFFLSLLLFLWILTLQVVGIFYAWRGYQAPTPSVQWCSPDFFHRSAVLSSECNLYPIIEDGPKGIGCISLQASLQRIWLLVTIIFGALFLLFEAFDLAFLIYFTTANQPATTATTATIAFPKQPKLKRPWFTMVFGLVALLIVSTLAVYQTIWIPKGITSRVLILGDFAGSEVCVATLTASGLRGEIISWADGLFDAWGCTYYGCDSV